MSSSGSKARYGLKEEVASERGDADGLAGSGTCIHVDTPSKDQPSVFFIQNLAGKSVSVPFNPEMTVGELQKQNEFDHGLMRRRGTWDAGVAPREGEKIPAERQCLVFEGRKLDANSRLADCGVSSNSKLYLIELQPRGTSSSRPNDNGCTIPQTEFRSITLRQLKEMAIEMMFRCHKDTWTSTNPAQKGKRLLPEEVTLYDLTHYFIKPVTKERQCSYVELIADAPRECMWFCSHWWGAPVLHFIACLEQHAMDRYLPHAADKVTYWICAYSNNQHNIQEEVHHSSPTDSSFYRAMQLSKGTVSILDADRVCYSRIWCGFEVSVAIRDIAEQRTEKYLYDIYSVSRQEVQPVGITDGYTAMDVDRQRRHKEIHNEEREILRFQMERQEMFPFTPEVLDVCIEKGEASVEEDKWKILNFVSGLRNGNTLQVPPKTHKSYDEVNALLRGRFAIATYRIALDNDFQVEKYREALTQYPGLIHLEMSFLGCTAFQNEAKDFMLSLPVSLLSLDLDYSEIYFDTSDDFIIGLNRLNRLESFALKLPDCDATTSVATIFSELYSLAPTLQNLSLNFKGCFSLDSSEDSFKTTLPTLINLKFLKLSFVRRKLALILQPLTELGNLQTLDLSFEEELPKGDYFCSTFSAMTGLKNLYLEFGQTWSLTSINGLLEEITRTNGLEVLSVKGLSYDGYVITKCPRLQGLESLTQLRELSFQIHNCPLPLGSWGSALKALPNIEKLSLSGELIFSFYSGHTPPRRPLVHVLTCGLCDVGSAIHDGHPSGVIDLAEGLSALSGSLTFLELSLSGKFTDFDIFCKCLTMLPRLRTLKIDYKEVTANGDLQVLGNAIHALVAIEVIDLAFESKSSWSITPFETFRNMAWRCMEIAAVLSVKVGASFNFKTLLDIGKCFVI